jgi:hypothetical protein
MGDSGYIFQALVRNRVKTHFTVDPGVVGTRL